MYTVLRYVNRRYRYAYQALRIINQHGKIKLTKGAEIVFSEISLKFRVKNIRKVKLSVVSNGKPQIIWFEVIDLKLVDSFGKADNQVLIALFNDDWTSIRLQQSIK